MGNLEALPVLEERVDVLDGEGQQLAHRLGVGVEDDRLGMDTVTGY